MRLLRRPRLLISEENHAPVTFGALKPVIILPQAIVAALPPEDVRVILGHELAHHRRRDPWLLWLQVIVSAIWWFNPVYWLLSRTVRSVREDCCDDMVVAAGIASRESYCRTLLQAARVTCRKPVAGAALAYLGESQPLRRRFNRIMTAGSIAFPKLAGRGMLAISALALFLLPGIKPRALAQNAIRAEAYTRNVNSAPPEPAAVLQNEDRSSKAGSGLSEVDRDSRTAGAPTQLRTERQEANIPSYYYYRKWMDEDVVYIISPEERSEFLALGTDRERDSFIEQFWNRRNPDPRSNDNAFKEEHYRRIAYANQHFASVVPGWKTERGRVHIMYGKPDELESHPTGGSYNRPYNEGGGTTSTYPFEKWRYRHIDGVGDDIEIEFVDRSRTGEYRMAVSPEDKIMEGTDFAGKVYYSLNMDCTAESTDKALCRITATFDNKDLEFTRQQNLHRATVNVYGKIGDDAGRLLAEWEDVIGVEYPDHLWESGKTKQSEYQKMVYLPRAGQLFKFEFDLKDINSKKVFEKKWGSKPANVEDAPPDAFERMKMYFEKMDRR